MRENLVLRERGTRMENDGRVRVAGGGIQINQRDCQMLTASSINDIAFVCNVAYSQVLNHINSCRTDQEILDNLQVFVFRHRPDLQ